MFTSTVSTTISVGSTSLSTASIDSEASAIISLVSTDSLDSTVSISSMSLVISQVCADSTASRTTSVHPIASYDAVSHSISVASQEICTSVISAVSRSISSAGSGITSSDIVISLSVVEIIEESLEEDSTSVEGSVISAISVCKQLASAIISASTDPCASMLDSVISVITISVLATSTSTD